MTAALTSLAAVVGSLWLLVRAGRTTPRFLLLIMAVWLLSPFVLFGVMNALSRRWSASARTALYAVMPAIAVASFAIYALVVLGFPQRRPTPVFVLIPPISWLLIAVVVARATLSRKVNRGEPAA